MPTIESVMCETIQSQEHAKNQHGSPKIAKLMNMTVRVITKHSILEYASVTSCHTSFNVHKVQTCDILVSTIVYNFSNMEYFLLVFLFMPSAVVFFCLAYGDVVVWMHRAHALGMTNGDYVFIRYDRVLDKEFEFVPWLTAPPYDTGVHNSEWRRAFFPFKQVCMGMLCYIFTSVNIP